MDRRDVESCNGVLQDQPRLQTLLRGEMANRLKAMGQANYRNGFELTLQPQMLDLPLHWRTPKRIFVNSMSDLFHVDVPLSYIRDVST